MTIVSITQLALQFGYWKGSRLKYSTHLLGVADLRDAQVKWSMLRDLKGWTMDTAPDCRIINIASPDVVARISYNGRIWDAQGKEIIP